MQSDVSLLVANYSSRVLELVIYFCLEIFILAAVSWPLYNVLMMCLLYVSIAKARLDDLLIEPIVAL